jgi:Membrane protein involved in colicin uptake
MRRKVTSFIPGFRTGRAWKKVIAGIAYPILIFFSFMMVIGSGDSQASSKDNMISLWENISIVCFLIIIPFILITNFGNIRKFLPLFKSKSKGKKIIAWVISFVIVFIGMTTISAKLSSQHSFEYIALQQKQREEQAIQSAKEKEDKEKARTIELAKRTAAEAIQASEEQVKKDAEEQAKRDAEEQTKKDAEEQAKKDAEEQTRKDAKEKTTLTQATATSVPVEANSIVEEKPKSADEENSESIGSKVSNWFGGLFGGSKSNVDANMNEKIEKSINNNLKKGDSEKLMDLYELSNNQMKTYFVDYINQKYHKELINNKELFEEKKVEKIKKLYEKMEFLTELSPLKNSDVYLILMNTKKFIEANEALKEFNKEYPKVGYGVVKDISQVENLDVYVNYKIKNTGTKIGNLTIEDESYSDNYFITSYSYSQAFGYVPSNDWQAVLRLSRDSELTGEGVYKTEGIASSTITLVDSKGFEKEYTVYREVSQEDIDEYNQVYDLMEQQGQINDEIDSSIDRIMDLL